eukprot:TRINITY_DN5680_c0_g1_i3.p1 TRINITY_DN5680_c0_g1~~TRINITY_DN5680_c0_g1_i3.p1  ORF type:complete len:282 (+),score=34.81 TRINITY_DN5680_c0_g1_i3:65-910(+)
MRHLHYCPQTCFSIRFATDEAVTMRSLNNRNAQRPESQWRVAPRLAASSPHADPQPGLPFQSECEHREEAVPPLWPHCVQCLATAHSRIAATCCGFYALSTNQVDDYGHGAVWVDPVTGAAHEDSFKAYSKLEVRTMIRVVGSLETGSPQFLHPLILAMDPNLRWPIHEYWPAGLHAALAECIDDDGYAAADVTEPQPPVGAACASPLPAWCSEQHSGALFNKCAHAGCATLTVPPVVLKLCVRCKNNAYCSAVCQRADWPRHRLTCRDFQRPQAECSTAK